MNDSSSTKGKNTAALHYSATYDNNNRYSGQTIPESSNSTKNDANAPRRVISESSFKARARNNINY